MRPATLSLTYPSASANGIATTQTPGGAGALTITAKTFTNPTYVTVTSGGSSEAGKNFTVVGTDSSGNALSSTIVGPGVGATVTTTRAYLTVTSITVDTATTGAITAGWAQSGNSKPCPMDQYQSPFNVGMGVVVSGTVNYTVQHTFDNVLDSTVTPTWFNHPVMASLTANQDGNYAFPVKAIRLKINSGSGTAALTILQAGTTG